MADLNDAVILYTSGTTQGPTGKIQRREVRPHRDAR